MGHKFYEVVRFRKGEVKPKSLGMKNLSLEEALKIVETTGYKRYDKAKKLIGFDSVRVQVDNNER